MLTPFDPYEADLAAIIRIAQQTGQGMDDLRQLLIHEALVARGEVSP